MSLIAALHAIRYNVESPDGQEVMCAFRTGNAML